MHHKSTLIFKSIFILWGFVQTLNITNYDIDAKANALTCFIDDDDVERAIDDFDAVIIDMNDFRKID